MSQDKVTYTTMQLSKVEEFHRNFDSALKSAKAESGRHHANRIDGEATAYEGTKSNAV